MPTQTVKTQSFQKTFSKKYEELFKFVERTGEEIFVFPKKYKVGISFKPIDALKKEFETKNALDKIQKGRKEHLEGKSEEFGSFLKKKVKKLNKKTVKFLTVLHLTSNYLNAKIKMLSG